MNGRISDEMHAMIADNVLQELMELPPEAQQEVLDFIAFLRRRYPVNDAVVSSLPPIRENAFIGLWQDREDMGVAGTWVRSLRDSEWR